LLCVLLNRVGSVSAWRINSRCRLEVVPTLYTLATLCFRIRRNVSHCLSGWTFATRVLIISHTPRGQGGIGILLSFLRTENRARTRARAVR
jgi:hypothetical protein